MYTAGYKGIVRKGCRTHKVDVVAIVAPDGTPHTLAGNHDFFTFCNGMECSTCKHLVRMWCSTCLVCHACFFAGAHPCTEVAVNVANDVCEDAKNDSADEWVSIHVMHKLGAARVGSCGRCNKTRYTARIGHKGIPLCPFGPPLPTLSATWRHHATCVAYLLSHG